MNHFERLFGILLVLQRKRAIAAAQLARQFEVSTRTIYRDLQTLSALGIPLYTTRGHGGGVRLREGYFLPPLTFSRGEGIVLLLGLTLLQSLRTFPFPQEAETAMQKLLVAVPGPLRTILVQAEKVIGFEHLPDDMFHPEPMPVLQREGDASESHIVTTFLQAILDRSLVRIRYASPYRRETGLEMAAIPLGLFWDRTHWYLVGRKREGDAALRLWRADRVGSLRRDSEAVSPSNAFDIQELLGHTWLRSAMEHRQSRAHDVWGGKSGDRLRIGALAWARGGIGRAESLAGAHERGTAAHGLDLRRNRGGGAMLSTWQRQEAETPGGSKLWTVPLP